MCNRVCVCDEMKFSAQLLPSEYVCLCNIVSVFYALLPLSRFSLNIFTSLWPVKIDANLNTI